MANPTKNTETSPEADAPPGFLQVMWSTLAAFFGVQNSRNRERDFTKGKASHFIAMGLLMTVAFIAVVLIAVKIAMSQAGGS